MPHSRGPDNIQLQGFWRKAACRSAGLRIFFIHSGHLESVAITYVTVFKLCVVRISLIHVDVFFSLGH